MVKILNKISRMLYAFRFRSATALYNQYEPYVSPIAFIAGFVWDSLTLTRIDLWLDNVILASYLLIIAISIIIRNAYAEGLIQHRLFEKYVLIFPFLLQFAFGGIFSGFFIFYSRSASLSASWPFLLFLLGLLIGNEVFRKRYRRFVFQVNIFFIALFSYAVLIVPILFDRIGADIFAISGLASLLVMSSVLFVLSRVTPSRFWQKKRMLWGSIGAIYLIFNILYVTNILPPVPLSLKEMGVYHSVVRTDAGVYIVEREHKPWYAPLLFSPDVFHRPEQAPVYVYSAVFAPTDITTRIFHRWAFYDMEQEQWIVTDRLSFSIVGGRDGGYRGFSVKENITPGKWRVDVITERDQLLGRKTFTVVPAAYPPPLESKTW